MCASKAEMSYRLRRFYCKTKIPPAAKNTVPVSEKMYANTHSLHPAAKMLRTKMNRAKIIERVKHSPRPAPSSLQTNIFSSSTNRTVCRFKGKIRLQKKSPPITMHPCRKKNALSLSSQVPFIVSTEIRRASSSFRGALKELCGFRAH